MLTTIDNPYDPFEHFDDWYNYDTEMNYNTCSYLDRVSTTSDELSDEDNDEIILQAMREIVKYNVSGVHVLVGPGEVEKMHKERNIPTNLASIANEKLKSKANEKLKSKAFNED